MCKQLILMVLKSLKSKQSGSKSEKKNSWTESSAKILYFISDQSGSGRNFNISFGLGPSWNPYLYFGWGPGLENVAHADLYVAFGLIDSLKSSYKHLLWQVFSYSNEKTAEIILKIWEENILQPLTCRGPKCSIASGLKCRIFFFSFFTKRSSFAAFFLVSFDIIKCLSNC